jgi:hypothetical protein
MYTIIPHYYTRPNYRALFAPNVAGGAAVCRCPAPGSLLTSRAFVVLVFSGGRRALHSAGSGKVIGLKFCCSSCWKQLVVAARCRLRFGTIAWGNDKGSARLPSAGMLTSGDWRAAAHATGAYDINVQAAHHTWPDARESDS